MKPTRLKYKNTHFTLHAAHILVFKSTFLSYNALFFHAYY